MNTQGIESGYWYEHGSNADTRVGTKDYRLTKQNLDAYIDQARQMRSQVFADFGRRMGKRLAGWFGAQRNAGEQSLPMDALHGGHRI